MPRPLPDEARARGGGRARSARATRPLSSPAAASSTPRRRTRCGALCEATGIPVGETQAGKGSLPYDHPSNLGAIGVTGTFAANRVAAEADLVIGVGTRYTDFTTASKTVFRDPAVRFVNVNVAELDAVKHAGDPARRRRAGDARAAGEPARRLRASTSDVPRRRGAG